MKLSPSFVNQNKGGGLVAVKEDVMNCGTLFAAPKFIYIQLGTITVDENFVHFICPLMKLSPSFANRNKGRGLVAAREDVMNCGTLFAAPKFIYIQLGTITVDENFVHFICPLMKLSPSFVNQNKGGGLVA